MSDRYFLVTEEEAKNAFGDGYQQYYNEQVGGYEAGYDHRTWSETSSNMTKALTCFIHYIAW